MSFLDRWAKGDFGHTGGKASGAHSSQTIEMRRKRFAEHATEAARNLRDGQPSKTMGWYSALSPEGFVVTLRVGVKMLDCGEGRTHTFCKDAESAAVFIEAAAEAATAGILDSALERAQIKRKRRTQEATS